MRILNQYLRRMVISSTFFVALILLGVESLLEFISQLSSIGVGHYGLWQALLVMLMRLPTDLYQLFPMAGFLGCLIGLGRLASGSELVVIRSSGVSVLQITFAVIKAAIIMIVVITLVGELIAPMLAVRAEQVKTKALGQHIKLKTQGGIWLRNHHAFVHIGHILDDKQIADVNEFVFDDHHHLLSSHFAKQGYYDQGHWYLKNPLISRFINHQVKVRNEKLQRLSIHFDPTLLEKGEHAIGQQSVWQLYQLIHYRMKAKLNSSSYQFAFWQRIIQPITTLVMICLGVPFIFGSLRSASMGSRILVGVMVGFAFYMLNQFFGPLAMVYQLSPLLAALMPTLLVALLVAALLIKRYLQSVLFLSR